MGQQQLLLLVLSTVIVGLVTVAGIQAFDQGSTQFSQEALMQTAVTIATDIQAEARTPATFGGAGIDNNAGFPGGYQPSLDDLGYDTEGNNRYQTPDGECFFETGGSATSSFDAGTTPSLSSSPPIVIGCENETSAVRVGLSGLDQDDITAAQTTL